MCSTSIQSEDKCLFKAYYVELGLDGHTYNPSTSAVEAGGLGIQEQHRLNEILSQNKNKVK